jgi:electron transfer flavoprotein alpha subunit
MSVLVYIEDENKEIKKSSFEAMAYAGALGEALGLEVHGVALSHVAEADLKGSGAYGIKTVHTVDAASLESGVTQAYAQAITDVANEAGSAVVVLPHSTIGEAVSSRIGIKLDASVATNVIGLPDTSAGFSVKRSIYTGKAFCMTDLKKDKKVLTVKKNSFGAETTGSGEASVVSSSVSGSDDAAKVKIIEVKKQEGDILLPEADLVVSAGRGLKGPENWTMIEELAKVLGAATACSKPVSDSDWRPHHEHVGQTGIKVSPNLYIAIGISGAIQHLAGVSSSKVIVVINIDPEAPFFKAADYGIVGDAFEVVPKLIEAFKNSL